MSGKKYDVEYYIDFSAKRIEATCQWESQKAGIDYKVLHRQAILLARKKAEAYNDQNGTSGFHRWFSNIAHTACANLILNPGEYEKLYMEVHKKALGEFIPVSTPVEKLEGATIPEAANTLISMANLTVQEKICTVCKESKSLDDFHNNKTQKDGKATVCKKCHNEKYVKPSSGTKLKFIDARSLNPDVNFDNKEIDDLIESMMPKLNKAKQAVVEAQLEFDRVAGTIEKLKRRRK